MPADLSLLLPRPQHVDADAGALCLAFLNTRPRTGGTPSDDDLQPGYANVLSWARGAGVVSDADTRRLLAVARRNAREASTVRRRIIELRETLRRVVGSMIGDDPAQPADLSRLEREIRDSYSEARLDFDDETGVLTWKWPEEPRLEQLLWPIVRSIEDLLFSDRIGRIRHCAGDDCTYIFLDTSRNRSRRYCSAAACGNRDRVRRFRESGSD